MTNRCPKCDGDRFDSHLLDKKDPNSSVLTIVHTDADGKDVSKPTDDGMSFVICAWCKNRVLFLDPTNKKAETPVSASSH